MKIELVVTPWNGDSPATPREARIMVVEEVHVNGVPVDGRREYQNFATEDGDTARISVNQLAASIEFDHGGFLVLRLTGVHEAQSWPADVYLEGSDPDNGVFLLPVSGLTTRFSKYAPA